MTITEELHIDCPPAMAFDLMADVRNLTDWNGGVTTAEMKGNGPIGKGASFVAVNRGQKMESTITTFDRPQRLDFAVSSRAMDVVGRFRFTSAGSATQLAMEFDPTPKGVMKVLFPVLKPLIRRDLAKQHAKFKEYCESQTRSQDA